MGFPARTLIPATFSLAGARRLPLTGEVHPLRREFGRWMSVANALALLLVASVLAVVLRDPAVKSPPFHIRTEIDNFYPRPVTPTPNVSPRHEGTVAGPVSPIAGEPEPVPWDPETPVEPTGFGNGDPAAIGSDEVDIYEGNPGPTVPAPGKEIIFTPAPEVRPVLLHLDRPAYPALARETGIEGTVLIRVLVGTDGRVKRALPITGNPILVPAAMASARTAVFKPARHREQGVEVWVDLPVVFSLR